MDTRLAKGLGTLVDVTRRLARYLVESDVSLDRASLTAAANGWLRDQPSDVARGVARRAVDEVIGFGPLEPILLDPLVSDVLVNGGGDVWVEREGVLSRSDIEVPAAVLRVAIERVIAPLGLRLDRASPSVDARLPDGSRLHAAIPPISVDGPILAIRRFTAVVPSLEALVEADGISAEGAEILREKVTGRSNLLVGGGTGAGKTTLLNILLGEVPSAERVVTVEDAAELRPAGHVVRLEARPANTEGAGAIDLSMLVRNALRLRPDRLVIGEVRGAEAFDMVLAMATGHSGSMSTVHAGSADEALWRVETLARSAPRAVADEAVRSQLLAALDVVVQMQRHDRGRRVGSIAVLEDAHLREVYRCS